MKTLFGKFLCFILRKHKRAKRLLLAASPPGYAAFQCPRCEQAWHRKAKPKPAAPAIPASIRK